MPIQANGQVPYAPPSTVIEIVERFRTRGLSEPFTVDVLMRAGVTESLAPRTLQALRLLDLVDDAGYSTPHLQALAKATAEEYKARFAEVIRDVYAEVFAFTDPSMDSVERVEDAFRSYNPRGQRGRAVTLFLGLCAHAGIIEESPAARPNPATRQPKAPLTRPDKKKSASGRTPQKFVAGSIDPALAGILGRLPIPGTSWTEGDRDAFIAALTAVVNLLYPVVGTSRVRAELTSGDNRG